MSRITIIRSVKSLFKALATLWIFSISGFSKSITPFASGPTISFSIYISGAFKKLPLFATASTVIALACPCAVILVPSTWSTAISTGEQ